MSDKYVSDENLLQVLKHVHGKFKTDIPTKVSELENDRSYVAENDLKLVTASMSSSPGNTSGEAGLQLTLAKSNYPSSPGDTGLSSVLLPLANNPTSHRFGLMTYEQTDKLEKLPTNETLVSTYATKEELSDIQSGGADLSNYYTKTETDNKFLSEIPSEYVTEDELNSSLSGKSDTDHTHKIFNGNVSFNDTVNYNGNVGFNDNVTFFGDVYNDNTKINFGEYVTESELEEKDYVTNNFLGSRDYVSSSELTSALNSLLLRAYPVGAIYMSTTNTNPSSFLGGTWVAWGSGKVPVGVDTSQTEFNSVEKSSGAKTNSYTPSGSVSGSIADTTLKENQIPSHTHSYTDNGHYHLLYSDTDYKVHAVNNGGTNVSSLRSLPSTSSSGYSFMTGQNSGTRPRGVNIERTITASTKIEINNAGGGQAHNHGFSGSFSGSASNISTLQPYITCYMWKRTA